MLSSGNRLLRNHRLNFIFVKIPFDITFRPSLRRAFSALSCAPANHYKCNMFEFGGMAFPAESDSARFSSFLIEFHHDRGNSFLFRSPPVRCRALASAPLVNSVY